MKRNLDKTVYLEEMNIKETNGRKEVVIDINEYPELYNKLIKLSHMNVRTVEQQALFYIMQAVGETEVTRKEE